MEFREEMTTSIERAGKRMRDSGLVDQWFEGRDRKLRKITENINGPLFEELMKETTYENGAFVEHFRRGDLCNIIRARVSSRNVQALPFVET